MSRVAVEQLRTISSPVELAHSITILLVNNESRNERRDVGSNSAHWNGALRWGSPQKIFVGYYSVRAAKDYCGGNDPSGND